MDTPKIATNKTEEELEKETVKWLSKLEEEWPSAKPTGLLGKEAIASVTENVEAYMKDCRHFMQKGDWVHAFEAIVYAWGIFDAATRMHALVKG